MMCYIGCPRTPSPEKKGSTYLGKCDNLDFKEKSLVSSENRKKKHFNLDQSELSTIKVGGPQFCVVGIWNFVVIS
jgi:hypothetical protein